MGHFTAAMIALLAPSSWGPEAAIVLAQPVETPTLEPADPVSWAGFRAALLDVAVLREIADPRERSHMLTRGHWQADVDELRRRAEELADAPPLSAVHGLPPKEVLVSGCEWNRQFRYFVAETQEYEPDRWEELNVVLCECDQLFRIWDAARDARSDCYYVLTRRRGLMQVRDAGGLTMPVPTWRYGRLSR